MNELERAIVAAAMAFSFSKGAKLGDAVAAGALALGQVRRRRREREGAVDLQEMALLIVQELDKEP